MNESTENDPSEKSPPSEAVVEQNTNQGTPENVEPKNSSPQNNSEVIVEPKNTPMQNTNQGTELQNGSGPEKVESKTSSPQIKPENVESNSSFPQNNWNTIIEPTNTPMPSVETEENLEPETKTIKKEPAPENTKTPDNEVTQNDCVVEMKPEINSIMSTPVESNTKEDNKTVTISKAEDNTTSGKVIVLSNMRKNTHIDDVCKMIKENTNNFIHKNIDNVHIIIGANGARACVAFKTEEHAALAKSLLKVMENPPFSDVSHFHGTSDQGTKRPATEATTEVSPVPQKQAKKQKIETQFVCDKKSDPKVIFLCNVPIKWNKEALINFIKVNSKAKPEVYKGLLYLHGETDDAGAFNGNWHLLFENTDVCKTAFYYLRKSNRVFNKAKIMVEYEYPYSTYAIPWLDNNTPDLEAIKEKQKHTGESAPPHIPLHYYMKQNTKWSLIPTSTDCDPSTQFIKLPSDSFDTYGLSLQFLEKIGIKPPLTTKLTVENLSQHYGDEEMIRKLFSHAGKVTNVAIMKHFRTEDNIAKVEFDHPVEAVQAISMFNNLEVYMKRIKVTMVQSRTAYRVYYPPGVAGFGPGLCPDGSALENVRNSIELQRAVKMLISRINSLHDMIQSLQQTMQNLTNQGNQSSANDVQTSLATMANNLSNAQTNPLLALSALLNPQAAQVLQLLQQQNMLIPVVTQVQSPAVTPKAQDLHCNANLPAHVHHSPATITPSNLQGTPIVQPVANVQTGPYVQSAPQIQTPRPPSAVPASYPQVGPNAPTGQNSQNTPNVQIGQYAQGGPNVTAQYAQHAPTAAIGQNVPAGHYGQTGPNNATGQYTQGGQNVLAGHFTPGGPNQATGQYAQGEQNMPARQFPQGGPVPATRQNMPTGKFRQNRPTAPIGQFTQGGPNAAPGQFAHGGPNAAPGQFAHGGSNPATGQYSQSAPVGQYRQDVSTPAGHLVQSGPNIPTGQYTQGGPNIAPGHGGPNMAPGQGGPNMVPGQGGPNMAPGHGGPNMAPGQGGPNMAPGQGGPNMAPGHGGPNMAPGRGPNLPPGQYDQGRSASNERYNQRTPNSQPRDDPWGQDSCTVAFSYLPPSVTLSALKSKMTEVGKVRAAEMTGMGRARVSFYSPRDAADCIQLLDHTKVDGQTIEVRYY